MKSFHPICRGEDGLEIKVCEWNYLWCEAFVRICHFVEMCMDMRNVYECHEWNIIGEADYYQIPFHCHIEKFEVWCETDF